MSARSDQLVALDELPRGIYAVLDRDEDRAVIQPVVGPKRQFGVPLSALQAAGVIANGIVPSRLELSQGGLWGVAPPAKPINEGHTLWPASGPAGQPLQLSEQDLAALSAGS